MLFISKQPIYHVILEGGQIISDPNTGVTRNVPPLKVIFKNGKYETSDHKVIRKLLTRRVELEEKRMVVGYWVDPRFEAEAEKIMTETGEGESLSVADELEALRQESAEKDARIAELEKAATSKSPSKPAKGSAGK
jgi:hypothetical protein